MSVTDYTDNLTSNLNVSFLGKIPKVIKLTNSLINTTLS